MKIQSFKKSLLLVSGIGILFAMQGCSSKEDQVLFAKIHKRSPELSQLQQTQRVILKKEEGKSDILIISYFYNKNSPTEDFIVASYPQGAVSMRRITIEKGISPSRVSSLSRSQLPSSLSNTIPNWFTLHRLKFPHTKAKRFKMHIVGSNGISEDIYFYKGPKYLITKPKF